MRECAMKVIQPTTYCHMNPKCKENENSSTSLDRDVFVFIVKKW